ncbi:hypothetical protein SHL15_7498 [Streptomyces hygroscopicus subsp. limoneus]|nr:hypothetical protein SHL15_7498 [Streptomyces hygroscopicus subsp. limoneus]
MPPAPGARDQARAGAVPEEPDIAVVVTVGAGCTEACHAGHAACDRLRGLLLDPAYIGTERVPREWAEGPVSAGAVHGALGPDRGRAQTRRAPGGDVAMLRQDQMFLAEDGTPWVRTDPAPDALDDDIRWHRPPRREYDRPTGGGFLWLGGAPAAAREGGVVEGAWWAAGGLAVGVLGTLLVRNAAARRGAGPPRDAPRRELIDL